MSDTKAYSISDMDDGTDVKAKLAAQQEQEDMQWLMSHKQGRRIVYRQLERTGVFRLSYSENPLHTAFCEGNRNEGLRALNMVNTYCQDNYFLMLKENHDG